MLGTVRKVTYFYAAVQDRPGEGVRLLQQLKSHGINLIAFTAFPVGEDKAQLDFFPEHPEQLLNAAEKEGITLIGPKKALLIQGDDRPGALVEYHLRLSEAGINVHAANGVSGGKGGFGYVLWVKPEAFERAAEVLGA